MDSLVISHGHADHGKGLGDFLAFNKTAKIYLRPSAFDPHFIRMLGLNFNIGLDSGLRADPRIILRMTYIGLTTNCCCSRM